MEEYLLYEEDKAEAAQFKRDFPLLEFDVGKIRVKTAALTA